MAIEEFNYTGIGPVPVWDPWVEFDGTNGSEITDWLNAKEMTQNQDAWTYTTLGGNLILTGSIVGQQPPITPRTWIRLQPSSGQNFLNRITPESQEGRVKTKDPYGRQPSIEYLVSPTGFPEVPPPMQIETP
jgi:hypothetical protein